MFTSFILLVLFISYLFPLNGDIYMYDLSDLSMLFLNFFGENLKTTGTGATAYEIADEMDKAVSILARPEGRALPYLKLYYIFQ